MRLLSLVGPTWPKGYAVVSGAQGAFLSGIFSGGRSSFVNLKASQLWASWETDLT